MIVLILAVQFLQKLLKHAYSKLTAWIAANNTSGPAFRSPMALSPWANRSQAPSVPGIATISPSFSSSHLNSSTLLFPALGPAYFGSSSTPHATYTSPSVSVVELNTNLPPSSFSSVPQFAFEIPWGWII